jgi:hypothetical protein
MERLSTSTVEGVVRHVAALIAVPVISFFPPVSHLPLFVPALTIAAAVNVLDWQLRTARNVLSSNQPCRVAAIVTSSVFFAFMLLHAVAMARLGTKP